MAKKRMLSQTIVDSDLFLNMSLTAQALYFHLAIRTDNDDFISNPKRIIRALGFNEDDLKILIMKQFVVPFGSGIIVLRGYEL